VVFDQKNDDGLNSFDDDLKNQTRDDGLKE
jgi:hypothetical protein